MATLEHPYTDLSGGQWLRGNLHIHSANSDGSRPRQEVIDDYAARGYDFLMFSDHDFYTSAEDLAADDNRGLVLIPGNEISRGGPHLLHVDAHGVVPPDEDRQIVIDAINADGGFAIINHPNWHANFNHCDQSLLEAWTGYAGIEIHNGVIGRLHGSPYATDRWDMLLTEQRRVWGYAHDDAHRADDMELGWNMVYARERTPEAVVEALRHGRFYAANGVRITGIEVDGTSISIETENAERIVALRESGRRFAVIDDARITVEVPEDVIYMRFECWGRGEDHAWTQPFFVNPA